MNGNMVINWDMVKKKKKKRYGHYGFTILMMMMMNVERDEMTDMETDIECE